MTPRGARLAGLIGLLVLATSTAVRAQDVPVVFLHGFRSDGAGWQTTAEGLRSRTQLAPHVPDLAWREPFADQARELWRRPSFAGLPFGSVLVGHSNGGLVARESFRQRPIGSIVTVGTPHRGAPILPQFGQWASYSSSTIPFVGSIVDAFSWPTDWSWVFANVVGALDWAADYSIWGVVYLGGALGLEAALPVAGDMHPASSYLEALNAPAHIQQEEYGLQARVGVVSVAHNFYWAGPARVIAPEQADHIAVALYGTAYGLMYWGNYILTSADPFDFDATSQGLSLLNLAGHLLSIDPFYCRLVSSLTFSACVENDGLVPYTSQEYPGALNLYLGANNDGPVHTREREASEDVLFDALVYFAGIPPRHSAPPPDPSPDPPPPDDPPDVPDDPPDDPDDPPADPDDPPDVPDDPPDDSEEPEVEVLHPEALERDQELAGDQWLDSSNGAYHLIFQLDGNFVLYDEAWEPLWASGTVGVEPGVVVMQGDGNVVLYDRYDVPRWSSGTYGNPDARLLVQNDGNVVIYSADDIPIWSSGTAR